MWLSNIGGHLRGYNLPTCQTSQESDSQQNHIVTDS